MRYSRRLLFTLCCTAAFVLFSTASLFAQDGAALFTSKCAACHGKDGAAKTPMGAKLKVQDLSSPTIQKMSDADLKKIVSDGKDKMPSYKAKLTKEQIDTLVAYVRSLKK